MKFHYTLARNIFAVMLVSNSVGDAQNSSQSSLQKAGSEIVTGAATTPKSQIASNSSAASPETVKSTAFTAQTGTVRQSPPYIILKFDDMFGSGDSVDSRWKEIFAYCQSEGIHASIGIICNSLETPSAGYISWIKQKQATGFFEFWNHGYNHKNWKTAEGVEMWEFKGPSYEEQKRHLFWSQTLAETRLGTPFATFGAPFNATDATTVKIINADPRTRIWLYGGAPDTPTKRVFDRTSGVGLEYTNVPFTPVRDRFVTEYNKYPQRAYFVLQGHPAKWSASGLTQFKGIISYLKEQKAIFVTPSEYANLTN